MVDWLDDKFGTVFNKLAGLLIGWLACRLVSFFVINYHLIDMFLGGNLFVPKGFKNRLIFFKLEFFYLNEQRRAL